MNQYDRYIYLVEFWQSKMITAKMLHELAEKQVNFYTQKMIDYQKQQLGMQDD